MLAVSCGDFNLLDPIQCIKKKIYIYIYIYIYINILYFILVNTKTVDSVFCALCLATQTVNILHYSLIHLQFLRARDTKLA